MSEPTRLGELLDVVRRMAVTEPADEAARVAARRRALLEAAAPAITPEDVDRLARDAQEPTPAIRVVQKWLGRVGVAADHVGPYPVAPSPRVLVLSGGVGCGKSVAAAYALAREPGYYATPDMLREAHRAASWRDDRWHRWAGCRLLVLDDLGTESADDFGSVLFEVVNRRATSGRQLTVITTNLTREEIAQRYDARVSDRLRQLAALVPIPNPSLRKEWKP